MTRRLVAFAALLAALSAPAFAADSVVRVTLDGRPLDKHQGSVAVLHRGAIYADVVDLTRAFDGLVTLGKGNSSAKILIGGNVGTFTVGSTMLRLGNRSLPLPGAPFVERGTIFVPLAAYVTRIAGARLRTSADVRRADIVVKLNGAAK